MRLYVHIPFCRRKCFYCAFFSQEFIPESKEIYLRGLEREIKFWSRSLNSPRVESVYFGGGTPSILSLFDLEKIIKALQEGFSFSEDMEFTLEGNPESLQDREYIRGVRDMGVNRLSVGLQSLRPEKLEMLGRIHSVRQGLDSLLLARDCGVDNIGVDLIWGLPGQTPAGWMEDLKTLIKYEPRHVSCYALTLEPGTPLAERVRDGDLQLPSEDEQARMYIYGSEYLEGAGLLQYEISNFARMGFTCRHNQAYWEQEDFLGLGPSAVSTVLGCRRQNPANVKDYAHMDLKSVPGGEYISRDKDLQEMIMLSLRTTRGLNLRDYRRISGENFCTRYRSLIQALHKNNLIRISHGYLRLTKNGFLVSDSIIARFLGWEE